LTYFRENIINTPSSIKNPMSAEDHNRTSFLDKLLAKQAKVLTIGSQGINVQPALDEVQRQIKQVCDGNPITGEGVTKSGEED
jgi:hypothetical protein